MFVSVALVVNNASANDFRGVSWGATPSQVKKSEKLKIYAEDTKSIAYKTTMANIKFYILYVFHEGRLVAAMYSNGESHTNKNDYISDFEKIKELLQKKYGVPSQEEQFWSNDLYKDEPSEWGMAVSVGHMKYIASWDDDNRTSVGTTLRGDNFKISHVILYQEKASQLLLDKKEESSILEQL